MATHRKTSAKKRIRTGEFAVAAFLGLAVTAAPAIATADTSDGPSTTGPSADKGSASNATGVKTGPKTAKTGKTGAGNGTPLRTQAVIAEEDEEDALGGEDIDDESEVAETETETGPEAGDGDGPGEGDEDAPPVTGTDTGSTGAEVAEPEVTAPGGAEPGVSEPVVVEREIVEPEIVEPEIVETPNTPETSPVVDVIEIPSSDQSASSLSLKGSDPSPTPTALASALLDIDLDIVPKPPVIPAFAPLMGIINGLASWVDKIFPPYAADPLLSPTQVAAGYVMTLFAGLQGTYWQGQPTPFTFGALVLVTAAYARYERVATNHLPGEPTISAGPLPLTWKLKSVDPDGDLLVYSVDLSGQPGNGLITMSPDGTFSFIPSSLTDLNDGTDVTFTVRVNDSLGMLEHPINPEGNDAFYTVSFRYPGLGINNLPVFTAPGQATVVGTDGTTGKVTISAQATDADGDPLTYTATSLFGTVTRNEDGTFTYTPNDAARHAAASDLAAALGLNKDLVSIWANDGRGGITLLPTTVTVDIVGANNAPTVTVKPPAISDPLTGLIAGGFEIDDDDNDLVTFSPGILTTTRGGLVTVTGLGYTYLPSIQARAQGGTDTFTVTADDGHGGTVQVSITVTIDKWNTSPIGGITISTPDSDGVVRGHVAATDLEGDSITFTLTGGASSGYSTKGGIVLLNSNGSFTYIPKPSTDLIPGLTTDTFEVELSDGNGGFATTTVIVSADLKLDPKVTSNAGGVINGGVDIDDNDNVGLLTYSVGTGPNKGTVTVNADGTYTYTATTAGWNETDSFTIIGTVNGLSITVATVSLVPKPNVAPTSPLLDGATIIGGSGIATGNIGASDDNGDTLHYSVTGYGGSSTKVLANGSIVTVDANGKWSYIPGLNSGVLGVILASTFTVYVSDGKGGETSTLVTVSTHDLDIPVTKNGSNGTVTGGLGLTAGEQGLMTYKLGTGPGKGGVTVNADGTYTYTATTAGWNETDSFTIVGVVNGVEITVANVSVVPKVNSTPNSKGLDGAVIVGGSGIATGNVDADDDDNDTLHYSVTGYGGSSSKVLSNGSIVTVDANGKWSYVPGQNSGILGAIIGSTFTVYVSDGKGGQTSTLVTVTTHDLDLPVTTTNGGHGVTTGGVQLTSSEQGVLTYSVGTGPTKGTVTINPDGTYSYTRTASGHTGGPTDTFQIVGSVGGVSIVVATVTVNPTLSNAAPTAGTTTITESSLGFDFLGIRTQSSKGKVTAFDADDDAISYPGGSIIPALYGTANGGSVSFYSDGTFTYSITKSNSYFHAAAANGATGLAVADTFTITVTDSLGASSTIVVSVPVEKLNSGPSSSVSVGGKTTDALGVVRGTISGSDDDDDSLTYTLVGGTNGTAATGGGGIIRFSGNSFTYIPTAGTSTDTFQVQVNDGHGGVSTATISLNSLGTPSPTTNVNTSTPNVVTGQLNTAGNTGLTYSVGGQGTKGTVTVSATGAFTYTRNGALGHTQTPADTFTIRATDAAGNSVIIATVNVTPTVTNAAPVAGTTVFTGSSIDDNRILGIGTLKQTTTGTLKATDADGDTVTFTAGSFSTANGGTVVVNANGTFTYTIDEGYSYYHGAAKIGASGSAVADSFSATAVDGFGGSTSYSVSVAIYAINSTPTISGGNKSFSNVIFVNVDDNDGDSLTFSHNGSSFSFGGRGLATSTLWGGNRLTVTDGYYVVVNGVVTGTPSTVTKTW